MDCIFHPCLKCVIGIKLRNAIKEYGYEIVKSELDSDVNGIASCYVGTNYVSNPVKEYLHETFLERQCD